MQPYSALRRSPPPSASVSTILLLELHRSWTDFRNNFEYLSTMNTHLWNML
jgi:hypothetical protein